MERFHLGYITPRFPCVSLVFEQNEILGLSSLPEIELSLLCCRPKSLTSAGEHHAFSRHLEEVCHYPTIGGVLQGLCLALFCTPVRLFQVILLSVVAITLQPLRAPQYCMAIAAALYGYPIALKRKWRWVHADFAMGSATVAWHLSRLLQIPFSCTAHSFELYSTSSLEREQGWFFTKKLHAARVVFGISNFAVDWIKKLAPNARTECLYVSCRPREAFQVEHNPSNKPLRIVALGRLLSCKGFDVAIRAISLLKDTAVLITLDIYGGGPEVDNLSGLIKELNLSSSVTLHGAYKQEDLPDIFMKTDVLVVPSIQSSYSHFDGIPTVIVEAFSYGIPVIASRLSGIPEVVKDGMTGVLFSPGDEKELAVHLKTFAENRGLVVAYGKTAREQALKEHDNIVHGEMMLSRFKTLSFI